MGLVADLEPRPNTSGNQEKNTSVLHGHSNWARRHWPDVPSLLLGLDTLRLEHRLPPIVCACVCRMFLFVRARKSRRRNGVFARGHLVTG